ncbi:probable iron/ascorbate oxidoreductase DDB_G0283291 [Porites lutea]|uniref:probable iron/ascorbate oxidoreductase DDB_G0283291 n=1 Tax=Porites lutea TaxID=51062 RepID=UPI003CC6A9AD
MACQGLSCFYITGHGIEKSLMENLLKCGNNFFNLPKDVKTSISLKKSQAYRGYILQGSEVTANRIDNKEGIYFGPEPTDDQDVAAISPMMGANQFPDEKALPGFKALVETYMERMSVVGHAIMKGLALSLELTEDFFHDIFNPAFPLLALWHYPPVPAVLDSWGVGPHTDYGVLTLLMQDDVGGLQIETESGKWIDVPPIPGTLVVNIGDVVEAWTKGKFHATMHRVKNSPSKHRISAPFFFQPRLDCEIRPINDGTSAESGVNFPLNKPFAFGEYVLKKFQKSYGISKGIS